MLSSGTVIIWDEMLSSGANVIIWDEMFSSGRRCYHLELLLSSGTKCYHLELLLSLEQMLSYGVNVIIQCYHVMLSSGMITTPFFIFPGNFTHSMKTQQIYPVFRYVMQWNLKYHSCVSNFDNTISIYLFTPICLFLLFFPTLSPLPSYLPIFLLSLLSLLILFILLTLPTLLSLLFLSFLSPNSSFSPFFLTLLSLLTLLAVFPLIALLTNKRYSILFYANYSQYSLDIFRLLLFHPSHESFFLFAYSHL